MPLVRIELPAGKSAAWKHAIADGVHAALVETAGVPIDDRFQILSEQAPDLRIVDPNYLGIARTNDFVLVQVFLSVGRSDAIKRSLYAAIVRNLAADPGLRPQDTMIALTENTRVDWSFGNGIAQYVPDP
jgi:4-oxalocrotonate tautomerase